MKLKPCPFCGSHEIESGEALSEKDGQHYSQAGCCDCGALGPIRPCDISDLPHNNTKSDNGWNKRVFN